MTESEQSAIAYLLKCGITPDASPVFTIGSYFFPSGTKAFIERLAQTLIPQ